MEMQRRGDIPPTCPILGGEPVQRDPVTGLLLPCEGCHRRRSDAPSGGCPGWLYQPPRSDGSADSPGAAYAKPHA